MYFPPLQHLQLPSIAKPAVLPLVLAGTLLVGACAAPAPGTGAATQSGATAATSTTGADAATTTGEAEEVCLYLKLTGTNIPKKFCRTEAEWKRLAENDRAISKEFFSQTQQRAGILENASPSPY